MANSGQSVIGVVQTEALATAVNLDATASGLRQYEPALKACMAHTTAAMGDSHQSDVSELQGVVESAIKAVNDWANFTASAAQRVRAIEART